MGIFFNRPRFENAMTETQEFISAPGNPDPVWVDGLPLRSGSNVTAKRALALPTVFRSVAIISSTCADLQAEVFRDGDLLDAQPRLITKPDPDRTYRDFIARAITCLALHGEAFVRVYFDGRNQVSFVQVLNPLNCTPSIDPSTGIKTYLYSENGKTFEYADHHDAVTKRQFSKPCVYHLRFMSVPGEVHGLGPIQAARTAIQNYLQAQDTAEQFFSDRTIPSGVLTTNQETNSDTAQALLSAWTDMVSSPGATALLPPGMDFKTLSLNPADLQFLESQNFGVLDIARLFGVPTIFLSAGIEGGSTTYTNVTETYRYFYAFTLRSYLGLLEDMFSGLLPGLQTVKFNTDGLLGSNESETVTLLRSAVDGGLMTVDEARARMKLPPMPKSEEAPAPDLTPTEETPNE